MILVGPAITVGKALKSATGQLALASIDTARLDAEVLLAHVLGCDRASLLMESSQVLSITQRKSFEALVERRCEHEPVAYIVEHKGFRNIDLYVDRRVLIPRPETEHLIEAALKLPQRLRVSDIGTGSGAIALALKQERPDLLVSATDIDPGAIAVAKHNAHMLGLDVDFDLCDGLERIDPGVEAIVSNPPYIPAPDRGTLPASVAAYEPKIALFAGEDGLEAYRRLASNARPLSKLKHVILEIGARQAEAVSRIFCEKGFMVNRIIRDFAGRDRVIVISSESPDF